MDEKQYKKLCGHSLSILELVCMFLKYIYRTLCNFFCCVNVKSQCDTHEDIALLIVFRYYGL
jgi:hypothetical protein